MQLDAKVRMIEYSSRKVTLPTLNEDHVNLNFNDQKCLTECRDTQVFILSVTSARIH